MGDLTVFSLCRVLANITNNRCIFVENSNICRCFDDTNGARTSNAVSGAADVTIGEVFLIFFVLGLWLSAIGYCLRQYKALRRFETQAHYFGDRKDPLNIGDIKIVAREQDSIIYKKKRYSTVLDTHINNEDLKKYHYVKQYLPRNTFDPTSGINALIINRDDLTATIPLSATVLHRNTSLPVAVKNPSMLTTHEEVAEDQPSPMRTSRQTPLVSYLSLENSSAKMMNRRFLGSRGAGRMSVGLAVPEIPSPNSSHSSWNSSQIYDSSCSAQHLSVPTSLRSTRFSDGNISSVQPFLRSKMTNDQSEQLIDPRLIPNSVRRSLLALHRESQENISVVRTKEKTQSENDVHGAFTPWKMKMKSKLKRTNLRQQKQQEQNEGSTKARAFSVFPVRCVSNDQERRISEYAMTNSNFRFSSPPIGSLSAAPNRILRRSLKHYPKYSTQSTSESEANNIDLQRTSTICDSIEEDRSQSTMTTKFDRTASFNSQC